MSKKGPHQAERDDVAHQLREALRTVESEREVDTSGHEIVKVRKRLVERAVNALEYPRDQ